MPYKESHEHRPLQQERGVPHTGGNLVVKAGTQEMDYSEDSEEDNRGQEQEVRGKEAITLFTALNTGHSGFGTLHANNSRETITRLTNAPMNVPKIMISSIDFIIMEKRIYRSDGISYRRITEIAEVVGMEEGTIQLSKLFQWDSENDEFRNLTIMSRTLEEIANLKGVSISFLNDEWKNRQKVLNYLVKNNISCQKDISDILETYYLNPAYVLDKIGA